MENATGSAFNDLIFGDSANNSLEGGFGNDYLDGGAGSDTFVFQSPPFGYDTIAYWQNGIDHISLEGSGLSFASFSVSQSGADTILSLISNPTQTITLPMSPVQLSPGIISLIEEGSADQTGRFMPAHKKSNLTQFQCQDRVFF